MKVFWTDRAKASLREIETYISKYSEKAARKVVKRVLLRSKQIGSFPCSGREVPEFKREDVREILEKPYRIIYGNTCGRPHGCR
jgi:toxin ParE1/3/4